MLFEILASAAEQRLCKFNAQDLANMAWAFAKADHSNELLFAGLVRVMGGRIAATNFT